MPSDSFLRTSRDGPDAGVVARKLREMDGMKGRGPQLKMVVEVDIETEMCVLHLFQYIAILELTWLSSSDTRARSLPRTRLTRFDPFVLSRSPSIDEGHQESSCPRLHQAPLSRDWVDKLEAETKGLTSIGAVRSSSFKPSYKYIAGEEGILRPRTGRDSRQHERKPLSQERQKERVGSGFASAASDP